MARLPTILLISLLALASSDDLNKYRLATNVWPSSYDVTLTPLYPDNIVDVTDFKGQVEIIAEVKDNTSTIELHAGNNISIIAAELLETDDVEFNVTLIAYDSETEKQTFSIEPELKINQTINLFINFTGKLEDDMHGFYKSSYTVLNNEEEETRIMLTTQFESTHARKAFPCFDEPMFKAKFKITLDVPSQYGALSNAAIQTATDTKITFKETVTMSTYLVAFIVYEKASYGPSIVVHAKDGVIITSWGRTTPIKNHMGDYSQQITHRILSELDDYTGIPYSTDGVMMKVDQAAIPDFSAGAMENWGLVTYRETGLLFDELNNTESSRKSIAAVIAHELTHQWFGNLVTLDWWSYTWLNEGFARYFQYFILESIYPRWRLMEQLVVDQQMSVFATDALVSAKALTWDVNSPAEIDGQFSSAAYSKGGAVIRLLSIAMGSENFQKGIREYLNERQFDTATSEHLFKALSNHVPEDLMPEGHTFDELEKWTTEPGYPVVTFARDSSNMNIIISQERFYLETVTNPASTIYPIYLEWSLDNGNHYTQWLMDKESSTETLPVNQNGWFLVNNTGYFRVNYDSQNWENLYHQLHHGNLGRITALDRATLVDNVLNFARTNLLSYETAISFVNYLEHETDYIPWTAAFSAFSFLHRMLVNVDDLGLFNRFVSTISQNVYEYLGFQDRGDHLEKIQRANTMVWACRTGVEDCQKQAVNLLTAYVEEGKRVPANLRSVAYCYGIKYGTDSMWAKMWQAFLTNEDAAETSLLISALGCSQMRSTLYMYLEQSLSGGVRQQDAASVFSAVYSNPDGVDVALDFLVDNFDRIERTYVSMNALQNVVTGIASYLTKEEQKQKMQKLVDDNPVTLASIGQTALATIETNLQWLSSNKENVLNTIREILDGDESSSS